MFLGSPTQGCQFPGTTLQSCLNSAGALGPSQNHSFSQWFPTFSKGSQCYLQLMIKSVAHCFSKVVEVAKIVGRDHIAKVFILTRFLKGFGLLVRF